jgi:hypothetical protein
MLKNTKEPKVGTKSLHFIRLIEEFTIILDKDDQILGFYGDCSLDGRYFWFGNGQTDGELCSTSAQARRYILYPEERPGVEEEEEASE